MYCKLQGHMEHEFTIKRRDEDFKKKKGWETKKKSKGEQEHGGETNAQVQEISNFQNAVKSHLKQIKEEISGMVMATIKQGANNKEKTL